MPPRSLLPALLLIAVPWRTVDPPLERRIPEIQGHSHYSPLAGRAVRSSGVVTSVTGTALTVQDTRGDGDPATSDALMLPADTTFPVSVGDVVAFSGTVEERVPGGERTFNLSLTTVAVTGLRVAGRASLPRPVVIGSGGRPIPTGAIVSADELPVDLRREREARANRFDPEADALDFLESLEGMRVAVPAPVAVSAMQTYGEPSSELFVLPDRGEAIAAARRTSAGGILLQSGPGNRGSQNPERIQIQLDAALVPGPVPPVSVGDTLGDVIGVLRYDYGNYEVAATEPIVVAPRATTETATRLGRRAGAFTVATYNVLNLSATPEDSLQRRLLGRQIAVALGAPEIVALQEIQDASGERDDGVTDATPTLRALIDAVRAAGGPAYRAFDVAPPDGRPGGAPGGNIRNAFLYDPASVRLVRYFSLTAARLAQAGIEHPDAFRQSRDPLLAEFALGTRRIALINNHLTSRYGSTPTYGAVHPFVQAGDEERARQSTALRAYAAHLLRQRPGLGIAVLGDMNTFEFTDDLATLLPGRPPLLHLLTAVIPPARRYTYNYEGNSQTLDHVFVSESLRSGVEVEVVHVNADRPTVPGHVASDHDPVVVRLRR